MDDIRGGRGNFLEPFSIDNQFFDPFDSAQLIDEIHKLFQYIDQSGKGYLEVNEILDFQA